MKIKKPDLTPLARLFPVGWPWGNTLMYGGTVLGLSALAALCIFANRYGRALDALYECDQWREERVLIRDALMVPFPEALGPALLALGPAALCCVLLPILLWLFHRQESRSDYLMRRLPQRWELARRCLAGPALLLACTLLAGLLLFALFFLWYQTATPAGHFPPDIWAMTGGQGYVGM